MSWSALVEVGLGPGIRLCLQRDKGEDETEKPPGLFLLSILRAWHSAVSFNRHLVSFKMRACPRKAWE